MTDPTDENGNEMPELVKLEQSETKSNCSPDTSDATATSVETDSLICDEKLEESFTETQPSLAAAQHSPAKMTSPVKATTPLEVTSPTTVGSPVKIGSPIKMRNIEELSDSKMTEITENDESAVVMSGPGGDAGLKMPVLSPRKSPKPPTRAYRMVCQCGAKNCRKFVF